MGVTLENHPLGKQFHQAEIEHLQSHRDMRSWTEIRSKDPGATDKQILDCMWVYVYKFDKHGRFQKCKARLVVRGDQQAKTTDTRNLRRHTCRKIIPHPDRSFSRQDVGRIVVRRAIRL